VLLLLVFYYLFMKTFAFPNYVNLSVGYSVPILVDEVDGVAIFHVDREN